MVLLTRSRKIYECILVLNDLICAFLANLGTPFEQDPRDGKQSEGDEPEKTGSPVDPQTIIH